MSWDGTREEEMSVNFLCVLDVSLTTRKGPRLNMPGIHEVSVYVTVLPQHPVPCVCTRSAQGLPGMPLFYVS